MKSMSILALTALTGAVFAADTVLLRMDGEKKIPFDGGGEIYTKEAYEGSGCYLVKGRTRLMSTQRIKIDPDRKYRLTMRVKAIGSKPGNLYAGWMCYTAGGKLIPTNAVNFVKGSFTELAAPAGKGAATVTIKDGSKWKSGEASFIVFDAKADNSDLPNFSFIGISKVEKKGDAWVLTLKKPLPAAYPAGTAVRDHLFGGNDFYFCCDRTVKPGEWQKVESPWIPGSQFHRGAVVRVALIVNLPDRASKAQVLIDDLEMQAHGGNVEF